MGIGHWVIGHYLIMGKNGRQVEEECEGGNCCTCFCSILIC